MPRGGATLLCSPRPGDWWAGTPRYEIPSATKDCKGAAVVSHPGLHHNSNIVSAILPNQNFVTPQVADVGPRHSSPTTPTNCAPSAMSGPQHHEEGLSTRQELERPVHPLPQRPIAYRHRPPTDSIERREVCRNFLNQRCTRGDTCHRKHIMEGDDVRSSSASAAPRPEPAVPATVPTPIPPPPANVALRADSTTVSSSLRIVNGLYIDRFSRQHALGIGGPSTALPHLSHIDNESELHRPLNHVPPPPQTLPLDACHFSPTTILYQTFSAPPTPHVQLPNPLSTILPSSITDEGKASSSSVHYPAMAAEEDTRPARRYNEVCRLYQTGQCLYGEKCHRTHTLALPIQVTALTSSAGTEKVKKPAPAPLPTHIGGVELCKLNLAGKCPRGDSCHYLHVDDIERLIEPQSRSRSPGRLKTTEMASAVAVPSQATEPPMEKPRSPQPTRQPPPTAARPSGLEPPRQKVHVTLPGDVCRAYFFGRHCNWPSCRYRHCSPEEAQALCERSLGTASSEAQSETTIPAEPPVPAEQSHSAPGVAGDDDDGSEHLRSSENGNEEDDKSIDEGSPRPSNTSKKPIKSRKKKDKGRGGVGEPGHEDGKEQAADVKEVPKIAEKVVAKEEKGKAKAKSKVKDLGKNDIKEKSSTGDPKVDGRSKALSGTIALGITVKDEQGKEGEKLKEKEKGKEKEKRTKRGKGKASAEVTSPTTAVNACETLRGAQQPSQTDLPHAKAPGSSQDAAIAQTQDYPGDGGDTDVEEGSSSYYTPGSGTISAQSSWSSMGGGSSVSTVHVNYCIDFMRGRCNRQVCRFSHDVPHSVLANAHPSSLSPHSGSLRRPSNANVVYNRDGLGGPRPVVGHPFAHHTPLRQDSSQEFRRPVPTIHSPTRVVGQTSAGSSAEPSVPPGLGLEAGADVNAGEAHQGEVADEAVTITVLDSTKVTFSSGFRVVQVNTGFESRQILLENLPANVVPADLKMALSHFGEITTVLAVETDENDSSAYRVSFSRAESANDAAAALDGSELFGSTVTAQVTARKSTGIGGGTLHDGDVLFELPTARQKGYVGYETLEKARKAIALATQKGMKGMRVTATIYEGIPVVGNINVRYENLPADATAKDLGQYGAFESYMVDRPKYHWTVKVAIDGLRRMLENHGEVTLNVLPPPYGKFFRVWAHFKDPQAASSAHEALDRFCPRFVGKQRIYAHHVRSILYNLPSSIYDILAPDLNLLRSYHSDEHATSISVFDRRVASPTAPVLVKLVSRNMASLTKLKTDLERLLRGEKVTDNGQIVWNDFFGGQAGKEFLDELEKVHPSVRINRDPRRRTLALFGPEQDRTPVRTEIIARTKLLHAQRKQRYTIAGNVIGVFMSEDLAILQKDLGHENVWIDLTHGQLVVCGDPDTQKVARLAVQHAGKRCKKRNARGEVGCPVCLGEVSQPVTLACGHTWCRSCLTGYMNASVDNKTFPLTCLGDDAKCSHHIPFSIAQQFLSPDEFDAVVNASFLAYVHSRPSEFHYCPTPDCPQVYRKSARGTVLQCPSCLARICGHCNMEYHESRSCQDRNPEDEKLFETWKQGHDVKDCPSCKVPIERMAGCNHMTCTSCGTHICWACLATFEMSGEVYAHMRSIHGGIGL